MKPFVKKLITFLASILLLGYVFIQFYPMFYSPVSTETVYTYSAYETINVDCIVIRNETPVPLNASQYVYYTVENGSRVSNGGTIAEFYATKEDALRKLQIDTIDEEIADLKQIQSLGVSGMAGLNILDTQIGRAMNELVASADAPTLPDDALLRQRLVSFLNKKQIVTGKSTDFSEQISALQTERNTLAAAYKPSTGVIKSPVAGYFVNAVDGLEGVLTVNTVTSMTTDNVRTAISTPLTPGNSSSFAGKIVSDYTWYLACVVPGAHGSTLAAGKSMHIRLPFVTDEEIPVTVAACNRDSNGELAVIFECVNMSEALSSIRQEYMEILLVEHTGLRVPKKAITTNAAQEVGVYIRSGDIVRFRKIEQEYSDAADYVIYTEKQEDGYLRLYDDIITEGSNLYDGKLIG